MLKIFANCRSSVCRFVVTTSGVVLVGGFVVLQPIVNRAPKWHNRRVGEGGTVQIRQDDPFDRRCRCIGLV